MLTFQILNISPDWIDRLSLPKSFTFYTRMLLIDLSWIVGCSSSVLKVGLIEMADELNEYLPSYTRFNTSTTIGC